jgi:hypothetical protein
MARAGEGETDDRISRRISRTKPFVTEHSSRSWRIAFDSGVRRPHAGHGRKHDPGREIVMQGTCPPTTPYGRFYIVRLPIKWIAVELNFRPRYRLRIRRKTPCSPKKFQIQGSP